MRCNLALCLERVLLMHCLFLAECKRSGVEESKKLYMCFVDWALGKKGLAEVLVPAVMSLYDGSRTKVRVRSKTSDEFGVQVDVH